MDKTAAMCEAGDAAAEAGSEQPAQPRARQTMRDVQKRRTRRKLLAAGRQLFAHGGYMTCTVEEVVNAAGISRAAFYLHYKSKNALLVDILTDGYRWQRRRYRSLAADSIPSAEALAAWIGRFIKAYGADQDSISLYQFAVAIDAEARRMNYAYRKQFVMSLSDQVPAFSVFDAAGRLDAVRYAELHLLLFEMDQLCVQIALDHWVTDPEIAIGALVKRFLDFGRAAAA